MYTPAFLEIFLGWCGVVLWATWLRPRVPEGLADRAVAAIPWATGVSVLAGQLAGFMGLMQQTAGEASGGAMALIRAGSIGSTGVIAIALLTEAGLTILWFVRPPAPQPRD